MGGLESTFAIWAERAVGWGPREAGYFFAYIGVLLILVQGGLVGPSVRRLGEARLAAPAIAAMARGHRHAALVAARFPLIAVSGALIVLGYGLGQPALTALISRAAPGRGPGGDPRRLAIGAEPGARVRADRGGRAVRRAWTRCALSRGRRDPGGGLRRGAHPGAQARPSAGTARRHGAALPDRKNNCF